MLIRVDTVDIPVTTNGKHPLTKRLSPTPDGRLLENEDVWPAGAIEQRTLELLNEGYSLLDTRIDGTRLFERKEAS